MIRAVQEVGAIISKAKPITESADSVTTFTEEFLKNVRRRRKRERGRER
jgi:hypothetical protein